MTKQANRTELKSKIARAQERQAIRGGASVVRVATDYIQERPFTAVAGSVAVGALVGATMPVGNVGGGASAESNGAAKKVGRAALGLGLNLVEEVGPFAVAKTSGEGSPRSTIYNDLATLAQREIAKALRKRMDG